MFKLYPWFIITGWVCVLCTVGRMGQAYINFLGVQVRQTAAAEMEDPRNERKLQLINRTICIYLDA